MPRTQNIQGGPDVPTLVARLAALINALEKDVRFRSNQAFYFLWDFCQRTRLNLHGIDIDKLNAGDGKAVEVYNDCVGRCAMTNMIIGDTTGRMALMMGGDPRNPTDFGPVLKEKANALVEH